MDDSIHNEEQFQALIEGSSDIITILDETGTIIYQSPSTSRVLGYDPGELLGDNGFSYVHPDDREHTFAEFSRALEDASYIPTIEHRYQHADGSYLTLESRGQNRFDDPNVQGFVVNSRDVTERVEREQTLTALREATNRLITTRCPTKVANAVITVAEDVLGESLTAVWLKETDPDRLTLTAQTDLLADLDLYDSIHPNNGLVWPVYRAGKTYVFDDIQTQDLAIPETPIHSAIMVPLGTHGVLGIGAHEHGKFTDNDVDFAEILASSATAALDRLEQEGELEFQNRRLDFLNHILRHDVLNSMFVVQSRAEMLKAHTNAQGARHLATILTWCDDIVSMTKEMRLIVDTMSGGEGKPVGPTNLSAALRATTSKVENTHDDVTFTTQIPERICVRANNTLSQVFDNLLGNAVTHNSNGDPAIDVWCEVYADEILVAIADNGGGIPEDQKATIFRRDVKGLESGGSGLGLYFVDTLIQSYGGDVWVENNSMGGATFFVSLSPVNSVE